jgi:hypothetical protein
MARDTMTHVLCALCFAYKSVVPGAGPLILPVPLLSVGVLLLLLSPPFVGILVLPPKSESMLEGASGGETGLTAAEIGAALTRDPGEAL